MVLARQKVVLLMDLFWGWSWWFSEESNVGEGGKWRWGSDMWAAVWYHLISWGMVKNGETQGQELVLATMCEVVGIRTAVEYTAQNWRSSLAEATGWICHHCAEDRESWVTGEFSRVRGSVKYGRRSVAQPSIRGFEGKEERWGISSDAGREARWMWSV